MFENRFNNNKQIPFCSRSRNEEEGWILQSLQMNWELNVFSLSLCCIEIEMIFLTQDFSSFTYKHENKSCKR